MRLKFIIFFSFILVLCSGLASADVIYEQLGNNGSGHNPFSQGNNYVAQDFTVNGSYYLNRLTFNAFTTDGTLPITDVFVNIYTDNAGSIGSLVDSEHITGSFSGTVTGNNDYYTFRDYSVSLDNIFLTSGTYWLALHVQPTQTDMHWTIPLWGSIGYGSLISVDGGLNYSSYDYEHNFTLEGCSSAVPEPASMLLLGLGLFGIAGFRKRMK
jgi:hypothetical protein